MIVMLQVPINNPKFYDLMKRKGLLWFVPNSDGTKIHRVGYAYLRGTGFEPRLQVVRREYRSHRAD